MEMYPFSFKPIALRKAKIVNNFGLSECNRVKFSFNCKICKNSGKTWRCTHTALSLLHSERPKLYTILAFLRAIGLRYPSIRVIIVL